MFCEQCGTRLSDDSKFCTSCGIKMCEVSNMEIQNESKECETLESKIKSRSNSHNRTKVIVLCIITVLTLGVIGVFVFRYFAGGLIGKNSLLTDREEEKIEELLQDYIDAIESKNANKYLNCVFPEDVSEKEGFEDVNYNRLLGGWYHDRFNFEVGWCNPVDIDMVEENYWIEYEILDIGKVEDYNGFYYCVANAPYEEIRDVIPNSETFEEEYLFRDGQPRIIPCDIDQYEDYRLVWIQIEYEMYGFLYGSFTMSDETTLAISEEQYNKYRNDMLERELLQIAYKCDGEWYISPNSFLTEGGIYFSRE